MTHKRCNLKYTLFFSEKLLQLNEILEREKGRKGYSSSVAVGRIMVWQSQFKSVNPRGIIGDIDYKKTFVQFGLEEENRHYTVTMNNVISGSIRKKMCL